MIYFTKLKRLWDELACLKQLSICVYGVATELNAITNEDKFIKF